MDSPGDHGSVRPSSRQVNTGGYQGNHPGNAHLYYQRGGAGADQSQTYQQHQQQQHGASYSNGGGNSQQNSGDRSEDGLHDLSMDYSDDGLHIGPTKQESSIDMSVGRNASGQSQSGGVHSVQSQSVRGAEIEMNIRD